MCFLLCTHSRFLPMEKGLHSKSVTTRSPATYVTCSPSPGCETSVSSGMNAVQVQEKHDVSLIVRVRTI